MDFWIEFLDFWDWICDGFLLFGLLLRDVILAFGEFLLNVDFICTLGCPKWIKAGASSVGSCTMFCSTRMSGRVSLRVNVAGFRSYKFAFLVLPSFTLSALYRSCRPVAILDVFLFCKSMSYLCTRSGVLGSQVLLLLPMFVGSRNSANRFPMEFARVPFSDIILMCGSGDAETCLMSGKLPLLLFSSSSSYSICFSLIGTIYVGAAKIDSDLTCCIS